MKSAVLEKLGKITLAGRKGSPKTKAVIATVCAALLIALICVVSQTLNDASINVSAHFSSVTEGRNPDGSPFNINEMMCDEVLERASAKLGGKVDAETIRKHLSVSDGTSSSDLANLKQKIVDGSTEYSFFPNVYTLTYSVVSDNIEREGFFASAGAVFKQIIMPSKKKILSSVAESYSEYYFEKYIAGNAAMNLDWSDTDSLDHYNRATETKAAAEKISRFILSKYNANPEFVSSEGIGYGELYAEIEQIIAIDVNNYMSFVIQNGVTSDKGSLLRQFAFMDGLYNEENERHISAYEITREVVDFYDSDTTKVVFVPALDETRTFYMNRTKVGIDYLIEKASYEKGMADEALHNSERYRYLIDRFSAADMTSEEMLSETDAMYDEVKEKINKFVEKADAVISEGSKSNEQKMIKVGKVYSGFDFVSMAVGGGKIFIMLLLIAFLGASLFDGIVKLWRKKRLAGEEECR